MRITYAGAAMLTLLTLSACENPLASFGKNEEAFAEKVHNAVKAELRDPESAQFSGEELFPDSDVACGFVNAKNGFGGYAGSMIYDYNKGSVLLREKLDIQTIAVSQACAIAAHNEAIADIKQRPADMRASNDSSPEHTKRNYELDKSLNNLTSYKMF